MKCFGRIGNQRLSDETDATHGQCPSGCSAMTAMPISAMLAPAKSQRVSVTPSISHSHTNATAMYMPP